MDINGHIAAGGYLVDADVLTRLDHGCDPALCREGRCCCSVYDVWVDAEEKRRLEKFLPHASAYLGRDRQGADINYYLRWIGAGYILKKDREGLCTLAYRADDGRILCSLHSVALELNCPPRRTKPGGCMLWPLSLSGAGNRIVSIQQGAFQSPCNRRGDNRRGLPYPGTVALLRDNFGDRFISELESGWEEDDRPCR